MNTENIPKYSPQEFELKWQDRWESEKIFEVSNEDNGKESAYILLEFPYPSGDGLHVGHCRSYSALDSLARKKRMQGIDVLFPMGWDAFGLPAELNAIKNKVRPQDSTAKNIANFKRQCKSLGLSFDWSREINTSDEDYYKWTQWIFLEFFKKGLAYQTQMPINWCEQCKTGLSNEEVIDSKHERCDSPVERRNIKQWMLKITEYADKLDQDLEKTNYLDHIKTHQKNWIGKSKGAEIDFKTDKDTTIKVYTTRPDTIYGVTYMVISPEHEDLEKLLTPEQAEEAHLYVKQAKSKSDLERTSLNKEKTGVFTGSFATNPLTNELIPVWISDYVLVNYGTGAIMAVPSHDERDMEFAEKFEIPTRQVIEDDRLINSGEFNNLKSKEAIQKITTHLEEKNIGKGTTNFKLRDWVFSRQRYWGEPIPIVHCDECGQVPLPESELPLTLPEVENYEPTDDGQSPLSLMTDWVNTSCPKCDKPAKRETDTMPGWAGSSWYYIRYTDPHNTKEIASEAAQKKWLPVQLYNGGMEHVTLHLLYSRFWHKFLHDQGAVTTPEPYNERIAHGMILDQKGDKMSKSRGNVVNPDEIVQKYGADTLRIYEYFIGPFDQSAAWNTNGVEGAYKFLSKVWNLQSKISEEEIDNKDLTILLHQTIKKVGDDIDTQSFNTAVSAMMILVNELQKQELVNKEDYKILVRILTPLAPHITEEIWSNLGEQDLIHKESWPKYDEDKLQSDMVKVMISVNGKVRSSIQISPNETEENAVSLAMECETVKKFTEDKDIIKKIYVPGRMINIVIK